MKFLGSLLSAAAFFAASAVAMPEAAPAPAPVPASGAQAPALPLAKRDQRPTEDDPNCWKCPTSSRFTLTEQTRRNDKEWTCVFKYDPPIWQFWNLIDRLDSGPKYCFYDTYYGEWTGQQGCSGYTCEYGCVYHMVDTCRTWN